MTEPTAAPPETPGHYEIETVIEVVDSRRRHRALAAILVLLVLLLAAGAYFVWTQSTPPGAPASAVAPDGLQWIRSIYGWGETPRELLQAPTDAAVAPDGTIWTISGKTTVVGFNPDGSPVRVLAFERGGQKGQVGSIEGVDVDDQGNLYLADFGLGKVHVVSPEGRFITEYEAQLPSEVAVDGDRVAIATVFGVVIYDGKDGTVISQFGTRGNQADQFDIPHGIVWGDDGNLYISDTLNRRIKAYTPEGRRLYIAPETMTTAKRAGMRSKEESAPTGTPYQLPSGMTRDAAGRLVLVDPFSFKIMAHRSSDGSVTQTWGEYGSADGKFAYPTGIDYDTERDYYVVADTANNRLQIVRLPGSGANETLSALRRVLDGPVWLCLIPFVLLLGAILLFWLQNRRRRRAEQAAQAVPQS